MVSSNALLFVNTMFGWPLIPSYDLPGGGPAYPLSALGVRLRVQAERRTSPCSAASIMAAPHRNNCGGPGPAKACNASGTSFPRWTANN